MIKYRVPEGKMNFNITRMECIKAVSFEASYSWELKFQRRGLMKISVFLALFCFVLAVGFSVAVTEIDLANMADEFEAEKLPG